MGNVNVRLDDVRMLAGYVADLEDDGSVASGHELEGAWEVIERLGLDRIVLRELERATA